MNQPLMPQPPVPGAQQALNGMITGRPIFSSVDMDVGAGQKVVCNGSTLLWKDEAMPMLTEIYNSLGAACSRKCAGDACCLNIYSGPGKIGFGFEMPGDMMAFSVTPGGGWILNDRAFVAGTENLNISGKFAGCCAMIFAKEGIFLTHLTVKEGSGMFYAGGFGAITRHDIAPGQVFLVEKGLFFAAHESTKLNIGTLGGLKTVCCTDNGIVMKFHGPCVIFTQNRDPSMFKKASKERQNNNMGAGAGGAGAGVAGGM